MLSVARPLRHARAPHNRTLQNRQLRAHFPSRIHQRISPQFHRHQRHLACWKRNTPFHCLRDNIHEEIQVCPHLVPMHRLEDEKARKHILNNSPLSPILAATNQNDLTMCAFSNFRIFLYIYKYRSPEQAPSLVTYEDPLARIMSQFKYTLHSCGHTLPKIEEIHDPSCKLCVPVLVALKYYHDQPTQVCIENALQQPPIRMPKPCRPIGTNTLGDPEEIELIHARDRRYFEGTMDHLGVNLAERSSIEQLASRQNQTSRRTTNVTLPLRPLSRSG